jgi:hypothetical protein
MSKCKYCKQDFVKKYTNLYCSKECYEKYHLEHQILFKHICKNCNKEFESKFKTHKFCSNSCSSKFNHNGGDRVSLKSFIKVYGEEQGAYKYKCFVDNLSNSLKGRESWCKGKHLSVRHKDNISKGVKQNEWHKNRKGKSLPISEKQRISKKMKGWTYTLKWFIDKFGEIIGPQKYQKRANIISEKSHFRIYNKTNKKNFSNLSQKLFWQIYNNLLILKNEKVYFAELNNEYSCELSHCCFDFVDKDRKKVIEFNGDKFHANPKFYKFNDTPNPYLKTMLAKEIWEMDEKKNNLARRKGYQVFIVWENDFKENEENVIKKCIEFLENK